MSEHSAVLPHVLVSPHHLAGAGDSGLVTTHLREHGWRDVSEPACLRTDLESPDSTIRLCLEPDPEHPWWTVLGTPLHGALWHATFQAHTPAELILAFAQALTHPDDAPSTDPFQVLHDAGWTQPFAHNPHYKRQPPDKLLTWDLRRDEDVNGWYARCRIAGTPVWSAVLSTHTPLPAVTAFATALADTRPLPRTLGSIPIAARRFLARNAPTSHPTTALPARLHPTPAVRIR
ncbi:hypothetical protein ACM01_15850 [Streptomyces viridochromogenes]|uniref:DUF317 domain-containing protein n=1 Tax=Streptomyces viridochromogenes TaxID=1938 RepID=A0A0J7ZE32_STRVR|nr:DUF317 domain-containing protein [Streptomyces viridochromogenes]KMS74094.1 hypothetical protein ACM01_15850 [Streptomyces viridochromogenes]